MDRRSIIALGGALVAAGTADANPVRHSLDDTGGTLLVKGGFLYTADKTNRVIPESWILVRDGRIAALGDASSEPPPAEQVLDARGKMILPGFVNPHWHESFVEGPDSAAPDDSGLETTPFAQGADIEALGEYFLDLTSVEDKLDPGDALVIARYSLWTQLRGGTALIGDTGSLNSADAMARAATELGMRINVGRWASDVVIPNDGKRSRRGWAWEDIARDWDTIAARWHGRGMVRFMPSVLVSFSCSDELLWALKAVVERHGLNYCAHLGAVPNEAEANIRAFGKSGIARFDAAGLLSEKMLSIHTNRLTDTEYQRMKAARVNICYSPANYGLLGERSISETRVAARFLRDSVPVSTSTDGNVSFAGGMVEAMRAMHLMLNESMGDNTACTPTTALATGTRFGAAGLGWGDRLGAVAPGMEADLVFVPIDEWRYRLVSHPLSVFLVAGSSADIDTVMIGGRTVIRGGRSTLVDDDKLYRDYERVVDRAREYVFGKQKALIR